MSILSPQISDTQYNFENMMAAFDMWASHTSQADNDWETSFPQWDMLIQSACQFMLTSSPTAESTHLLAHCRRITEETEDCAECAREFIDQKNVRDTVFLLTKDTDPYVRWQAYDALGYASNVDEALMNCLEFGTMDEDNYVRRRSFLALSKVIQQKHVGLIMKMLHDSDAYNRYVAVTKALEQKDANLKSEVEHLLGKDVLLRENLNKYSKPAKTTTGS